MTEIERQIQESLAAAHQAARISAEPPASLRGFLSAGLPLSVPETAEAPCAALSDPPARSGQKSVPPVRTAELPHLIPDYAGPLSGVWDNPCIGAAMPLLLLVERLRSDTPHAFSRLRPRIGREIEAFRQKLSQQHYPAEQISHLSYLLCTYIDGIVASRQTEDQGHLSLLVEFHGDAWGGENCFTHLCHYLTEPRQYLSLLGFYDLILSLGFEGKYQMLERGPALLRELRQQLHTLIYGQHARRPLTEIPVRKIVPRRPALRASHLFGYGFLLCLLAYGITAWHLHAQARHIRHAILAWVPPAPRKINIMERLPDPLTQILNEGWLEVRKDPRGWLLIFTSDGAFHTGSAQLSEAFVQKRNIERLGLALAPWPGDLEVIGHTDNQPFRRSSANSNLRLSAARAQVVANKLRDSTALNHSHPREIVAVGRGESEPIADNATEAGRRRNRRVDILWKIAPRNADLALDAYQESAPPQADRE